MMKQYAFGIVLLSLVCLSVALKEEDCEVCVATIKEFAETLTDDVKADPKKIEDAFKEYCTTAKSKQQRLVCTVTRISNTFSNLLDLI